MRDTCDRCGRETARSPWAEYPASDGDYIAIDHAGYGCDTGCCGLEAVLVRGNGAGGRRVEFDFMHDQAQLLKGLRDRFPSTPVRLMCWWCYEYGDGQCAPEDASELQANPKQGS